MKRILIVASVLALLGAAPAGAQLDMSNYVALGDSATAGLVSGGLVDCYQHLSYPAMLADQAGSPAFEMPLISAPGVPSVLQLVSLAGGVPVIEPVGDFMDSFPYNVEYPLPYNNLAVPTATLYDMLFQIGDIQNLAVGNFENIMFDLILRIPQVPNPATGEPMDFTAVVQAVALQPSFVTVWIGMNDILGGVVSGTPISGITMTPVETFGLLYPQAVGALATQTTADIVLFTIPDLSELAFATTVPPFLDIPGLGVVPIMGSNGPLTANSRVTLLASELLALGYGVPLPGFPPLPDDFDLTTGAPGYILRPDEIALLKSHTAALNGVIRATAAQFGLPVFEAGAVSDRATSGEGYTYGGVNLNGDFLTGGLISFDGIHPNQLGHALLANELIGFLNDTYSAGIEPLNLNEILFDNPCIPLPAPAGIDGASVTFSPEARDTLLEMFMPDLPTQGPVENTSTTAAD